MLILKKNQYCNFKIFRAEENTHKEPAETRK